MASTSSSDGNDDECLCGEFNNNATPWAMHPLVYYTQMPYHRNTRSRERKKRNPNCFVKAFRWYTQERNPCQKTNSTTTNTPDIGGFATWLDDKYTEFLQESRVARMKYTLQQTSTVEINKVSNNPRKRHRKLTNSKDNGDILLRSNKSFEFILRPKNLSRAASETCPRQGSCCTNFTETTTDKKRKTKSQSLTSILVEKEVYSIPYDVMHTDKVSCNEKCSVNQKNKQKCNVSCQCSEIVEKVDRSIQYQSNARRQNFKVLCACIKEPPQTQVNTVEQKLSVCTCANGTRKEPSTYSEKYYARSKPTSKCANDGTQTSDYPINFVCNTLMNSNASQLT
ncbi:unnamed protein product [Colias eurytheme]|nr:unnamed protein product [Colias eurytheme]